MEFNFHYFFYLWYMQVSAQDYQPISIYLYIYIWERDIKRFSPFCLKSSVFNWAESSSLPVDWLCNQVQEETCLHFQCVGYRHIHHAWLLHEYYRFGLIFSCLQNKGSYPLNHLFSTNWHFTSDMFLKITDAFRVFRTFLGI